MINRADLQSLIHRESGPVLSVYLDMSVNSDNKRTHQLFLQQQRSQFTELESDRANHHREPVGAAFSALENWLATEYNQSSRGVAVFIDLNGTHIEAFQLPVRVDNRLTISDHPLVGPLVQIIETHKRHVIALVDRERLRLLSVYLGQVLEDFDLPTEPYPTPHDVNKGGSAQKDYQKWKAEETRQFFKRFSDELIAFARRHHADDFILLGTDENVKHFHEFLPKEVQDMVVHTAAARHGENAADILERLDAFFNEQREKENAETISRIHERVRNQHFATAGVQQTLERLQEGKVDRLIVARDIASAGVQCQKCGFLLARKDASCPYCGGETRDGIDVVEEMIRMAASQEVPIQFADRSSLEALEGVGAFLKF